MNKIFENILFLAFVCSNFIAAMAGVAASLIYLDYLDFMAWAFVLFCAIALLMILKIVLDAQEIIQKANNARH